MQKIGIVVYSRDFKAVFIKRKKIASNHVVVILQNSVNLDVQT